MEAVHDRVSLAADLEDRDRRERAGSRTSTSWYSAITPSSIASRRCVPASSTVTSTA
jgi:hypothetical protein